MTVTRFFLIFTATCSHEFGLQSQNTRYENKAGQTEGTSMWLYGCMS